MVKAHIVLKKLSVSWETDTTKLCLVLTWIRDGKEATRSEEKVKKATLYLTLSQRYISKNGLIRKTENPKIPKLEVIEKAQNTPYFDNEAAEHPRVTVVFPRSQSKVVAELRPEPIFLTSVLSTT